MVTALRVWLLIDHAVVYQSDKYPTSHVQIKLKLHCERKSFISIWRSLKYSVKLKQTLPKSFQIRR